MKNTGDALRSSATASHSAFYILHSAFLFACLLPFLWLVWRGFSGDLGANPIEEITHLTGQWALRLLLVTLAITPLRRITGWHRIIGLRRTIGLFAFFYASLHFLTYMVLDQFFAFDAIVEDIAKRPYITVGFSAFLLLIPLAITSTTGWVRRLGGRRWAALHRVIYVSAILAVVHFAWKVKADLREPLTYGAILAALLAFRLRWIFRKSRAASPAVYLPARSADRFPRRHRSAP